MTFSTTVLPPCVRRAFLVSLAALAFILAVAPTSATASTCTLISPAPTTNWTDPTKWTSCGGTYPGANAGDTAIVTSSTFNLNINAIIPNGVILQMSGGSVSITIPSGSALQIEASSSAASTNSISINGGQLGVGAGTITWGGALTHNTGTLALTGTLVNTAAGTFTINGGSIQGPGTLSISGSTSVSFTGSGGGMTVNGAFVDVFGVLSYTSNSSQSLSLNNGAHIKVESGGQFNISGNDPIQTNSVGGPAIDVLAVSASMTKNGGTGTTQIDPAVNNAGTVMVVTGRLNLYGGGTHTGVFSTATGGDFMGFNGTHALQPGTTASGGGTFELVGGNFNVNTTAGSPWAPSLFTQGGGTLAGTGTIQVTSTFTWTGGTQSSSGTTKLTGTTNVNGGAVQIDSGRTMTNSGTFNYAPTSGFLTIDGGAHIDNSGTINLQNDAIINSSSPSTSYILTNGTGFLKKTAGTSTSINCSVRLNGQGTLQPAANTNISLNGGTGAGTFGGATATIDLTGANSEIYLAGGTFVWAGAAGSLVVNGGGELRLANAVLQLTSGPLTVSNFTFDGASGLLQSSVAGLSINGSGGVFTWDGGTIDGLGAGADVITVNGPTGSLVLTGSVAPMTLQSAAHIKNAGGSIDFNPVANLAINSGSVLDNTSGSFTFNNNNAFGITTDNFSNPGFFNSGSVTKAANPNTAQVDVKFVSTTTVTVNGGTLRLMGGGSNSGSMIATNAADRIEIGGGTYQMNAGATVGGSGTFAVNAGALLTNNTALSVTNFELSGTVNGGGNLAIGNTFKWLTGGFTGSGSATVAGVATTDATALVGAPTLADGFIFNNNGTFNYNPSFGLTFNNSGGGGATFNNNVGGVFDIQGNGNTSVIGAGHSFLNSGTVRKTAGAGGFTFTVAVTNQGAGVVDEQFGSASTIAFNNAGNVMNGGTIKASNAAGDIDFTGGTFTVSGGSFAGPGTINVKGATLTINSPQTFSTLFTMNAGQINGNGSGSIDVASGAALNWSGGSIGGSALITILSGGSINADTSTNSLVFDTRPLLINSGGQFTWNNGGNSLIFQSGSSVTDNGAFNVGTANGTLGNNTGGSFSVAGTFTHNNAGTLNVTLPLSVAAGGTITSSGGSILVLTTTGIHDGTFDAQSGSFIDFGGGTHQMNPGSGFSAGTGTYKVAAGTLNLLNTTNVSAPNFILFGGSINGSGNLDITASFLWSGGQMAGTGLTTVASGTATFNTGPLDLNRNLTLNGNTTMNAPNGFNVQTTATVTNNATFNLQIGNVSCVSCTTASFANNGTIQKTAPSTSTWSVPITGSGILALSSGTFAGQAAATFGSSTINNATGTFSGSPITFSGITGSNGIFQVTGGSTTVSGTTTLSSGSSQLRVSGGTLTLNGTASTDSLLVTGGTLTGTGNLTTNTTASTWSGGTITGSGALTLNAALVIDGASGAMVLGRNLTNNSTITYNPPNASQVLTTNAGIILTNNGQFDITGGFDLLSLGGFGTSAIFTNTATGTLNRTSGSANAINFGPQVNTAGTTNWTVGSTTFTNGFSQSAGTTNLNGATIGAAVPPLAIGGGVLNARGTILNTLSVNGTFNPGSSPGAVTITGAYVQGSTGVMNVELNGTVAGTSYDQVNVQSNATLNGTLNATLGYSAANGDVYDVMTIGGTRTGDFATKNLPTTPAGPFTAAYLGSAPETLRITAVVPNADLSLTVSAPATMLHGQNATLTYTIANLGSAPANSVVFNDTLTNATLVSITSSGTCTTSPIVCTIGTLAGGASTIVTMQINASTLGTATSNASVSHSVADPTPGNNSATTSITVTPASDFGVLSVNAPATVNAASNFTDTVTVKNAGPDAGAPSLSVSVTGGTIVSAGGGGYTCSFSTSTATCTGPTIAANGTAAVDIGINAQSSPGTVVLTATVSSASDPNSANNSGSGSSNIGNVADVSVIKSGPPTAGVGANVGYTIKVTNNGPADATSVTVNDSTPSRLAFVSLTGASCAGFPCSLGTLTTGQSVTLTATYTVAQGPPVVITNTATATTATLDPNPGNDAGSAITAVGCGGGGPTPISPAANSVVGSPATFTWSAVPGAIDYTVTVNTTGTPVTLGPTANTTISGAVPDGAGFWNVSANFGGQCTNVPSANVAITVCSGNATPVLRLVSEAVSGQPYRLEWDAVPSATKYEIDESPNAGFTSVTTTTTTDVGAGFQKSVSAATPFFYRVRAFLACAGKLGPNSIAARIVIAPPPPPNDPNPNVNVPAGNNNLVTQIVHVPGLPNGTFSFVAAADQPWFTVAPVTGVMPPSGFDFTVTFNPALLPGVNGTFSGTILVTLQTGASAIGRVSALDNTTVKAPVSVSLVTPVSSTSKTALPANALIVPSVGHLTGVNSVWRSDIRLANVGFTKTKYQLTFTPTGDDASKPVKTTIIDVDAGGTIALDDIVRNWYGVGSLGEGANGTLEIHPASASGTSIETTAVVSSRTYNVSAQGTLGQFIPAIPFGSFISKAAAGGFPTILGLQQIAQNADFRTNLGLVEAAGKPATVLVSVFDALGNSIFSQSLSLAAGEQKQLNSFLAANDITLADGRIEVQVTGGDGRITAYASRVDNKSGDPLLVSGVPLRAATASKYVLPGVATINSGFANWQSDVRLFNAGTTPSTPTVTYYPQNGSPSSAALTVNPGETKQLDNVLQTLFGLADTGGALHFTTSNATNLVISGRTYNQTTNGTFGQFIPAVTPNEAVGADGRALQILQAEESVRYRTNLGIAEVTGKEAVVELSVFVPGSKIAPRTQFTIGPNEFRQFNVLHEIGMDNVYNARIQVRVLSGDGKITAYGSVVDMITQDGTYVPGQ